MNKEEKKAVAKHISAIGGFGEDTKGYQAMESLIEMGEWSFYWFEKPFCLEMAKWLQRIKLQVQIRDDAVKLSDDALFKYYQNVMGLKVAPSEPEKSYYERLKGI